MNSPEVQENLKSYVETGLGRIGDAVEVITGDREIDPVVALVAPMQNPEEARADSAPLPLTAEQETDLREIAGWFGIGGEADVVSAAGYQILEGGKPWKIEAEAAIAGHTKTIIFAGSSFRKLGADETAYLEAKLGGVDGETEYDMARQIAESQDGFVGLERDEILPFGYEVTPEHALVSGPTGQLVKIGKIHGRPVWLLRVDGETYTDEEGNAKQRNRPDSAALMSFVAEVLSAGGDQTSSVGLDTSTTYATRVIDTVRAGLRHDRTFDVGMYGRQTLADIKGEPAAQPTAINQIPGELRVAYDKLIQLKHELEA